MNPKLVPIQLCSSIEEFLSSVGLCISVTYWCEEGESTYTLFSKYNHCNVVMRGVEPNLQQDYVRHLSIRIISLLLEPLHKHIEELEGAMDRIPRPVDKEA